MRMSRVSILGILAGAMLTLFIPIEAQCNPALHAGIRAQIVPMKEGYTEPAHVHLSFVLLNDSDSAVDFATNSWKIVVDGTELPELGQIFGDFPMPELGTQLQPGQNFQFNKHLPLAKYFPQPGEHRVSWRGKDFQSPTIIVKTPDLMSGKRAVESPHQHTGVMPTLFIPVEAQCDPGLHAGIGARVKEGLFDHVFLLFVLLNDSDSAIDVAPGSWRIVVDGAELAEPVGRGLVPGEGWTPLQPGQHYQFGRELDETKYFLHPGEHRVSWRGQGFQSSTIIVKTPDWWR